MAIDHARPAWRHQSANRQMPIWQNKAIRANLNDTNAGRTGGAPASTLAEGPNWDNSSDFNAASDARNRRPPWQNKANAKTRAFPKPLVAAGFSPSPAPFRTKTPRSVGSRAARSTLSFPSGHFDVVLCQLGLQFFPDQHAALREMRRPTMREGGKFTFPQEAYVAIARNPL